LANTKNYPAVQYTSRDFNSIKRDLVNYAKRYYANTYQDFSEAGFGSLMLDTVAYVGDILSFYVDYNVNECFLDTAIEYDNVIKLGRQMGFRFKGSSTSSGQASFYIIIPANSTGDDLDYAYVPTLKKGSRFSSGDGITFTLNENINFANPSNEHTTAVVTETGNITSYAVKAQGQVISGELFEERVVVGDYQKFFRAQLNGSNINEIISVVDSEGKEYYEVDYLAQDVVYRSLLNTDSDYKTETTAVLRPFAVPRRFMVEQVQGDMFLQFGFGSEDNTGADTLIDPSKVILDVHGKDYTSDVSLDPTNLLGSDKFGVAPSNTILTITYRANTIDNVNVSANGLVNVDGPLFDFNDLSVLSGDQVENVINSLEVNNEEPILGDVSLPSTNELKQMIYNTFASQNRAVTALDYKAMCYAMPPQFGKIKRVNIVKDRGSLKRNLNAYLLSEDVNGHFIQTNSTIKSNLKQWLNQSRMINDTVDILDAKIINIGIDFDIVTSLNANRFDILDQAVASIGAFLNEKLEIGEPFYFSTIYNRLNSIPGIADTTRVKVYQKTGNNYSSNFRFIIDNHISNDGRYIVVPDNAVLELKYPDVDIKGNIR
jgi:hypothetical protein